MDQALTRGSRLLALGGVAAVIFGVVALVWPSITLIALVILFGAYALVYGVLAVVSGIDLATEHARHWIPMVLSGIVGIVVGALTFFRPGITALALIYVIAFWAIATGVFEFATGIQLTGRIGSAWMLWLSGLLSVAFGVVIGLWPVSGALAIVWLIGVYAIVVGVLRVVFALRTRDVRDTARSAAASLAGATRT